MKYPYRLIGVSDYGFNKPDLDYMRHLKRLPDGYPLPKGYRFIESIGGVSVFDDTGGLRTQFWALERFLDEEEWKLYE